MPEQTPLHFVSCIDSETSSASVGSEASGIAAGTASGGDVGLEDVVHHHAVGAEPPTKRADGLLHARDPFAGQAVSIPVVVERDHLVAEHAEQRLAVTEVVQLG